MTGKAAAVTVGYIYGNPIVDGGVVFDIGREECAATVASWIRISSWQIYGGTE